MKIAFLITARLKSTRLPMKLLKELENKTVIETVINRIRDIDDSLDIVMCTSKNHQDLPLVDIAIKNNIYYFNGNEEDVLQRLLDASLLYGLDYFIGITGENPLFCLETAKEVLSKAREGKFDFIYPAGLPIGCAIYAMNIKALKTVCNIKKVIDTEIWGYLINRPEVFDVEIFNVPESLHWPDLRITMDYPEDFQFIQTVFEKLNLEERKDLKLVLQYLKENPDIVGINAHRKQLDLDEKVKAEINSFFVENKEQILLTKEKIYNDDLR